MVRSSRLLFIAIALLAVPSLSLAQSPAPAKSIDAERFYSGRWLEIARLPLRLTDGCVAGATAYSRLPDGQVAVRDSCRDKTPDGKEKVIRGKGRILDPGANAKLRVRYPFFITWDYWVLDVADDYSWFISADPKFDKLWIYTRNAPSPSELDSLVARVKALGYDASRLEFPEPLKD